MIDPRHRRFLLPALLTLASVIFISGITWGLPGRHADPYLFGNHPVWTGRQIMQLTGGWDARGNAGADVDANPLDRSISPDGSIPLNSTDEDRAAIILRYRLYSHQPDEMITFRALAGMRPARLQLDPKLYQYGGLWIYPVGAILQIGSLVGLIDLTGDLAHYLEHPDAFGRFYVVARLYSAGWGVAGAWVVFAIIRRLGTGDALPTLGTLLYMLMPVVVTMAHEAKPHLPGAVLMLLATLAAARYVEGGSRRRAIVAGALCGAAGGMVLSAIVVFVVLPLMTLLRRDHWRRRIGIAAISIAAGIGVYAAVNPFVPIHLVGELLGRETPLASNLNNSAAMYRPSSPIESGIDAARWLAAGMTTPLAMTAALAAVVLTGRWIYRRHPASPLMLLLVAPAAVVLVQFVMLAAGKPGEYARFALFADVVLVIVSTVAIGRLVSSERWQTAAGGVLVFCVAIAGLEYVAAFRRDADPTLNSRMVSALAIRQAVGMKTPTVAVPAEPAPYTCPPINVFDWRIVLPPKDVPRYASADLTIVLQEDGRPITWASKAFGFVNAISGMFEPEKP